MQVVISVLWVVWRILNQSTEATEHRRGKISVPALPSSVGTFFSEKEITQLKVILEKYKKIEKGITDWE